MGGSYLRGGASHVPGQRMRGVTSLACCTLPPRNGGGVDIDMSILDSTLARMHFVRGKGVRGWDDSLFRNTPVLTSPATFFVIAEMTFG